MPLAFSPSIQPVQIPLQRLSTLKQVDTPTQLGVTCKLSEGAFHPLVQCRLPCSLPRGGRAWDSVPTSPQGAEICLAGHPREEISRGRLNFSLVSLPRDGLQPSLPSGCCPGLSVETSAEHVPLGRAKDGPAEEGVLASLLVAPPGSWNCPVLMAQQTQKMQLMLEEVARLRAEISSMKQEVEEMKQAASERALEAYVEMSDWALQSSGASIDLQRTSETYTCKNDWFWRFIEFFCTPRGPDRILQPDVSPGNCWPFPGHQGQVVIRLPARVHLTAITVQHISKEVSPSGTVTSAPRDIAVFGVDVDGEEETLLVTFMYDVAKEAIQTFPLKNAPHPRAFSYLKLLVKSNWGKPKYTCIYRVQVHGKMAKPNSLN
ncbi:SUN domain-containing protein 3-like isoform X1 [Larus michahellis]|uniref:SUN domain-containing protein 3-like isoform X1 n=1 Tax=Larus michahellis TaxID=119627 RepID=UPI003D9B98A0